MQIGKTSVFVPPPIIAAMRKMLTTLELGDYLNSWDLKILNLSQRTFIERYYAPNGKPYDPSRVFPGNELKSFSDTSAKNLNKILSANGFPDIQFNDFGQNGFGVAAILDIALNWLVKGHYTLLFRDGKSYPAVRMEGGFEILKDGERDVIAIRTKEETLVYMTVADKPRAGLDLAYRIDSVANGLKKDTAVPGTLFFPMISAKTNTDISWLEGLRTRGNGYAIERALQQTKIKMNEAGAAVKSAAALTVRLVSYEEKKNISIDEPLFMWMERGGVRCFYGYFGTDSWSDPRGLRL